MLQRNRSWATKTPIVGHMEARAMQKLLQQAIAICPLSTIVAWL